MGAVRYFRYVVEEIINRIMDSIGQPQTVLTTNDVCGSNLDFDPEVFR